MTGLAPATANTSATANRLKPVICMKSQGVFETSELPSEIHLQNQGGHNILRIHTVRLAIWLIGTAQAVKP